MSIRVHILIVVHPRLRRPDREDRKEINSCGCFLSEGIYLFSRLRVQISPPGRLVVVPLVFKLISSSWPDHVLRMWLETNRNSLFPKLWFHSQWKNTFM